MRTQALISRLRRRDAPIDEFRSDASELSKIFAFESREYLEKKYGKEFAKELTLVPILRSGLIMLPAFLEIYPKALVGIIGAARDEKTAIPHLYYQKLPKHNAKQRVLLLDPMLATGNSAVLAVELLKKSGILESQITLLSFFAAPEGIDHFKKRCPKSDVVVAQIEQGLDAHKIIVPGVGDFGDRYFGTCTS